MYSTYVVNNDYSDPAASGNEVMTMKTASANWYIKNPKYNYNNECHQWCDLGSITLTKPTAFRKYEETASRDHDVIVPAGSYPVRALRINGNRWHSLLVDMPGYCMQVYPFQAARNPEFSFLPHVTIDGDSLIVDGECL